MKRRADALGIYIHFPYCLQKCSYCDFYSVGVFNRSADVPDGRGVPQTLIDRFESAVLKELSERLPDFADKKTVDSIYFGGGTSSLLPPEAIAALLAAVRENFNVEPGCEITLEGNPENMRPHYLTALSQTGVNRVNVGIQTFNGPLLESVNRYYDPERYASILSDLSGSPISNVGVDLIYGFPGQTLDDFMRDLDAVCSVSLRHLSVYSLTVEAGTAYAGAVNSGKAPPPGEDLQEQIFRALPDVLSSRGLRMYEVSNYAVPGYECRHNLRYWLCEPYIGLGPGAHGFNGAYRYGNVRNTEAWERAPAAARKTTAAPYDEIALNLLRLALPFELNLVRDILVESSQRLTGAGAQAPSNMDAAIPAGIRLLEQWGREGLASVHDGTFQWNMKGLLRLDDHIAEMADALERATAPVS